VLSTLVVALLVLVFALVAGAAGWLVWRLWVGPATAPAAGAPDPDPAEES
jgi:Flp pilus assembly protein CpaB